MEVFTFGLGDPVVTEDKAVLGGKGANLVTMSELGLPVPPGVIVPTSASVKYNETKSNDIIEDATSSVMVELKKMEDMFNYMPLLSVRSGAPVSMPGMMDTILNVGLTPDNITDWQSRIGERTAVDSLRRLVEMMGTTALGVNPSNFVSAKEASEMDTNTLTAAAIQGLENIKAVSNQGVPSDLRGQVKMAIKAVFDSWGNERAQKYRSLENISPSMGTAVVVQAMVFGNLNDRSGSGVAFTRNPLTGEPGLFGEFLVNSQGEDVVAGLRTPTNMSDLAKAEPVWFEKVESMSKLLENHHKDMQDIEFTIQDDKVWMLQCRSGKRTSIAAFKIAHDLVEEGLVDTTAIPRLITRKQFFTVTGGKMLDPKHSNDTPLFTGIPGCGGTVQGRAVFSSKEAVKQSKKGPVILIAKETSPEDFAGMVASAAIVTATGGTTSHAAVVARGMDRTCVVGCSDLMINGKEAQVGSHKIMPNDWITVVGDTGSVYAGKLEIISAADNETVNKVMTEISKNVPPQLFISTSGDKEVKDTMVHVVSANCTLDNFDKLLEFIVEKIDKGIVLLDITSPSKLHNSSMPWLMAKEDTRHNSILKRLSNALECKNDLSGLFIKCDEPNSEQKELLKLSSDKFIYVEKMGSLLNHDLPPFVSVSKKAFETFGTPTQGKDFVSAAEVPIINTSTRRQALAQVLEG